MARRFALSLALITLLFPSVPLLSSAQADAATWNQWQRTCTKWVLDVSKVDSSIKVDTARLNFTYLTVDFAGLAIDGRHIKACNISPDRVFNSLLVKYGGALYIAGYGCATWAASKGQTSFSPCYQSILKEKSIENQVSNRAAALQG